MPEKFLFVDDDPHILAAFERTLRRSFPLDTAAGPELGLEAVEKSGPYAVIIADRQMPGMDGIQFLATVREKAPDSVRIMLTGNADLEGAIRVVNEGNIFRFLTKPCPSEVLTKALEDGLAQYRLIIAERELLNRTLKGSVKVLTDLLTMVEPGAFGRAQRLRTRLETLTRQMRMSSTWEFHLAVMLAPIGLITLPPEVALKARCGYSLSDVERSILERVPEIGRNLLTNIPRLDGVAQIVLYQNKRYDGSSFPPDRVSGDKIPLGARLLKVLADLADLEAKRRTTPQALKALRERQGWYDPRILEAACAAFADQGETDGVSRGASIPISLEELRSGHILVADMETADGKLVVVAAGQVITDASLEKVRNFVRLNLIKEPIFVDEIMATPDLLV